MACKILSAFPATSWSALFCLVLAATAGCTSNERGDDDVNTPRAGSGGRGPVVPGVIGSTGGGGAGPVDPDHRPTIVQGDELSCAQLLDCLPPCGNDEACADQCVEQANATSLNTFLDLAECAEAQACEDGACLADECSLYLQACRDDEPVDPPDPVVVPNNPAQPFVTVPTGRAEDALGKDVYGPEVQALVGDVRANCNLDQLGGFRCWDKGVRLAVDTMGDVFIVRSIDLYVNVTGNGLSYQGELPAGLTSDMRADEVHATLGAPAQIAGGTEIYPLGAIKLFVEYLPPASPKAGLLDTVQIGHND